jgi:hypothetical protein
LFKRDQRVDLSEQNANLTTTKDEGVDLESLRKGTFKPGTVDGTETISTLTKDDTLEAIAEQKAKA